MENDSVPLAVTFFLLGGERRGKLCIAVGNKKTTMPPGAVMMACFSPSGPNILFYRENLGRDAVPLAIIIFYYGEKRGKQCLAVQVEK